MVAGASSRVERQKTKHERRRSRRLYGVTSALGLIRFEEVDAKIKLGYKTALLLPFVFSVIALALWLLSPSRLPPAA